MTFPAFIVPPSVEIAFVGSATGSAIDGGTVTIDMTTISGLAQNDIVLAFATSNAGGTAAAPGGWTEIFTNATRKCSLSYKIMGASPDTSVSFWDTGTTSDSGSGLVMAFRGVNTSTPLDVTSTEDDTQNNEVIDPPAITPTSDNCGIVIFGRCTDLVTPANWPQPTNYSVSVATNSNDTNDTSVVSAYRLLSGGAGVPETPSPWTGLAVLAIYTATVALRPA